MPSVYFSKLLADLNFRDEIVTPKITAISKPEPIILKKGPRIRGN